MTPCKRTSARGKSPGRGAAAAKSTAETKSPAETTSQAETTSPTPAVADYWWLYCVYCAAEFAGACVLLEDRLRDTNVCVLCVFMCLLLNARYLAAAPHGAHIDEVMQLKLPHVLWNVWVLSKLGAATAALDAAFERVPWALPAPGAEQCAGSHLKLEVKCLYLAELEREAAKERVLWQSVSAAVALLALTSRSKWIPFLCFVACACKSMA